MELTTWDNLKSALTVSWAKIDSDVLTGKFVEQNEKYKLFVDSYTDTEYKIHRYTKDEDIKESRIGDINLYYFFDDDIFFFDIKPYYSRNTKVEKDNFTGDEYFLKFLEKILSTSEYNGNRKDDILFITSYIYSFISGFQDNIPKSPKCFDNIFPYISRLLKIYSESIHMTRNDVIEGIKDLHSRKNRDYTVGSEDPLINFMLLSKTSVIIQPNDEANKTIIGFLWRIGDKISRIRSFNKFGSLKVTDDPYEDAIRDFLTYVGLLYAYINRYNDIENGKI